MNVLENTLRLREKWLLMTSFLKLTLAHPILLTKYLVVFQIKNPVKYRCKKAVFDETEVLGLLPVEITSNAQEYKENG